jgi:glutaredoxin 3
MTATHAPLLPEEHPAALGVQRLTYELWQTEWCPASRRVRQRLTELGIDYVTRQVPVDKDERILLRERTGTDTIPVLVTPDEAPLAGEAAILAYLERHEPLPATARAHRLKAEKARRRYLEEECKCPPQPATR